MAYRVIMCYHLHMPLYILGTFTEYPRGNAPMAFCCILLLFQDIHFRRSGSPQWSHLHVFSHDDVFLSEC